MPELESVKILQKLGISYRLIRLQAKGVSFNDVVSNAVDQVNPAEICKTIIATDEHSNKCAFFLKGDQKVDFAKIKLLIGKKLSIVSYENLKKETGAEPGAVCPFLLKIPIFADPKVFECKNINFGSGDHLLGLEIASKDLKKVIQFKIVDISK